MEDVLDLYHEEYDRERPVVCFDETSKQLLGDVRPPVKAKPGRVERYDTEYQRNGTRNLFMFCEPKGGWRHVEVTGRRTGWSPPQIYDVAGNVHLLHTAGAKVELLPLSAGGGGFGVRIQPGVLPRRRRGRLRSGSASQGSTSGAGRGVAAGLGASVVGRHSGRCRVERLISLNAAGRVELSRQTTGRGNETYIDSAGVCGVAHHRRNRPCCRRWRFRRQSSRRGL